MKHIIISLLVSSLLVISSAFAQETTTTTTTTTDVESKEIPAKTTTVRKIITTEEGTTYTVIEPKRVTKTTVPKRVIVREALDTFLAIGVRMPIDYHLSPSKASVSCMGVFAEIYGNHWGVDVGLGCSEEPITSHTNTDTSGGTGVGVKNYINLDIMGKYYFWFSPRNFWVGGGLAYADFTDGYIDTTAAAVTTGFTVENADNRMYLQLGVGMRFAIMLERLHFTPDLRYMFPLDTNTSGILRVNLALTYDFAL